MVFLRPFISQAGYNFFMPVDFQKWLRRYGPQGNHLVPSLGQARNFCSRFTRGNYENFSVISCLMPRPLVPHFEAVYSFCRWADDLGDQSVSPAEALELLRWWRKELEKCFHGEARHPVFVALLPTVREFQIPIQPFRNLIFAFEQDQLIHEYQTYEQLLGYCQNSANPVGRLVLRLWGCADGASDSYSDAICTGLQLANFWQDVARDADIGRIYLPADLRNYWGYTREDLLARRQNPAFASLMEDLVGRAEALFQRGQNLIHLAPVARRIDLGLFIEGGRAVLEKIRKLNFRVWESRPRLSHLDKGVILAKVFWRHFPSWISSFC